MGPDTEGGGAVPAYPESRELKMRVCVGSVTSVG